MPTSLAPVPRSFARACLVLSSAVLVLGLALPATAGPERPGSRGLLPAPIQALQERTRTAKRLLNAAGVANAVRAAMGLARITPESVPASTAPISLPTSSPAVARVLQAISTAARAAKSSLHVQAATLSRRALSLDGAFVRAVKSANMSGTLPRGTGRVASFGRDIDSVVDRRLLYSAALQLATAIDGALPELREGATAGPRPDPTGECDVQQAGNTLCIGGPGDNTYTHDYTLLIDQGGNDTYLNDAGAADPLRNRQQVSVVIDLGGNDQYTSSLPTPTGSFIAQGAGEYGGIGMIVDGAGSDAFSVDETQQPSTPVVIGGQDVPARVCAIGCGYAGVGIVASAGTSLDGADTYSYTNHAPSYGGVGPTFSDETNGLGFGFVGGLGILSDQGAPGSIGTKDSYTLEGTPALPVGREAAGVNPRTVGLGTGFLGGVGLFSDNGGADQLSSLTTVPSDARGVGDSEGMGEAAFGGIGAALEIGTGDTTWTIRERNDRVGSVPTAEPCPTNVFSVGSGDAAIGLGSAVVGAVAVAYDAGAAKTDSFILDAEGRAVDEESSSMDTIASASTAGTVIKGEGLATLGSVALLENGGGANTYLIRGVSEATAHATDTDVSQGDGPSATAIAGVAVLWGQGFESSDAAAALVDSVGDDTYTATGESVAGARAVPAQGGPPGIASAQSWGAQALGQGTSLSTIGAPPFTGAGVLLDYGGTDHYASSTHSSATADPEAVRCDNGAQSWGQAVGGGPGLFADLLDNGAPDTFTASPDATPAVGTRGESVWENGAAVGMNVG